MGRQSLWRSPVPEITQQSIQKLFEFYLPPPQALYFAVTFIDFDSLRGACQISTSRQKMRGSGQKSTIEISCKGEVGRP